MLQSGTDALERLRFVTSRGPSGPGSNFRLLGLVSLTKFGEDAILVSTGSEGVCADILSEIVGPETNPASAIEAKEGRFLNVGLWKLSNTGCAATVKVFGAFVFGNQNCGSVSSRDR